jgi:hypothetical protein
MREFGKNGKFVGVYLFVKFTERCLVLGGEKASESPFLFELTQVWKF